MNKLITEVVTRTNQYFRGWCGWATVEQYSKLSKAELLEHKRQLDSYDFGLSPWNYKAVQA